ncbi:MULTISPECIES: K(+)-transporting ATPase subunit F [Corynebacterium]|jgi:K+-transporting ATPase, F subunit|uniref:K(+)-transporting ATPase subunit F n=3 Tax=Corynebacterium TaxID=1716 RepID=A0A7Y9ZZC8_9CORY|nr:MULTISPECIES: K(+)-transporting ATPase subunit F [Corynebacterium]PZP12683.1 MAG: K(+)-transporting ATPase subunit F [Brachybacterium faecium]EET77308.1 K+-transporting ATPase, F subunit [Corynebacterium tuberculostearicum SK141]ERS50149.1 K+-transporting ATPase, F subunit [Corynebacterium sp. KPL1856]ERS50556.1 K+-transporting ATPase, F subunit [Corynebacterium sp. KPL1860]ERS55563.1 K+-transporting ATPase, F subunit [Corynebacterium sp. KPL1821]
MNTITAVIGLVIVVALVTYLIISLVDPERFA